MLSVFPVVKAKAPPHFEKFKSLYATLWVVYYVTFVLLTMVLLFYGFWSSGYFGGPEAATDEEPPRGSFKDRCLTCFHACGACFSCCTDSHLAFWSGMITLMVIVLVMFTLSVALALMSGLKVWVSAGCSEIYVLNDNTICLQVMQGIRHWLGTFWSTDPNTPLEAMCASKTLNTCGAISAQLKQSALFTTFGSMLAAVVTCQMIFESARLHEGARWRRLIEGGDADKGLLLKNED